MTDFDPDDRPKPKGPPIPKYDSENKNTDGKVRSSPIALHAAGVLIHEKDDEPWGDIPQVLSGTAPEDNFPLHTLPPKIAAWVPEAARAASCAISVIVIAFLVVAAALIGNARVGRVWAGWTVPMILRGLIIGDPSSNKSPGLSLVLAMVYRLEAELRDEFDQRERHDRPENGSSLRAKVRRAAAERGYDLDPDVEPPVTTAGRPQLVIDETTKPGLEGPAIANPRGLILAKDEISPVFGAEGKPIRSMVLTSYDAGRHRRSLNNADKDIARFALSMLGGIQPRILETLLDSLERDGFGARTLPVVVGPSPIQEPGAAVDDADMMEILSWCLSLDLPMSSHGPEPREIPYSSEAQALIQERRIKARAAQDISYGLMAGFFGKLAGTEGRLATLLTLLDAAAEGGDEPEVVERDAVQRAAEISDSFLVPHAHAAFDLESQAPVVRDARIVIAVMRRLGKRVVTGRELTRAPGHSFKTIENIAPALSHLEDVGVIRWVPGTRPGPKGGRPSDGYLVSPKIWPPELAPQT